MTIESITDSFESTSSESNSDSWDDVSEEVSNDESESVADDSEGEEDSSEAKPKAKEASKEAKEAADKAEKKLEQQRERRLRKLLIDGKEELVDEEEAFKSYAKNKTADKRLAEAAQAKKQLEAFKAAFEKDPLAILNQKNLPISKRELAEQWLKEAIEEELKDPRDIELEQKTKKLQEYEQAIAESKKAKEQQELAAKVNEKREALAKVFEEAMSSTMLSSDPSTSAEVLREMAMYMRVHRQNNPDDPMPTAEELAAHVENNKLKQYHSVAQSLTGEQLLQFLGEGIVNKIRRADLDRIKAKRGISENTTTPSDSWEDDKPKKSTSKGFMNPYEAKEAVRKKLGL
jgi:hypothetical protein